MNLALNARDAMPRGGDLSVTVSLADDAPETDAPRAAKLVVSDTGEGMPEHVVARAFQPFFTTKQGDKGTGLGLATCFGIAKQYGGSIRLSSKVGAGTSCAVWLPIHDEPPATSPLPVAGRAPRSSPGEGPATVLLVDDDATVRFALARVLRASGFEVLEAASGAQAVDLLARSPIDALVTDVLLPAVPGPEIARVAREHCPQAVLIFMSGYAEPELVRQGVPDDVSLLEKPFPPKQLVDLLRSLIAARRASVG